MTADSTARLPCLGHFQSDPSLLQSRYAESAGDLGHLRLCERFALFNGLLYGAKDNLFEKFDVVRIDNFSVNFNCDDVARAIRRNFYLSATGAYFNGLLRSEEHTSELQSRRDLVCRLLLEKK